MIGDSLFIQLVDHRVSTALIFFLLMVLLNTESLNRNSDCVPWLRSSPCAR